MAGPDRDVSGLIVYGPYALADDASALLPGVWYNVNDSGVLFKHYAIADWLVALADYHMITGEFDWDEAIPPFVQSCVCGDWRVTLQCTDTVTYLSIEHAMDAREQES